MKKYLIQITILMAVIISLTNCSKYAEGPLISFSSKNARLTGNWYMTFQDLIPTSDSIVWTFKEDETFTKSYNGTVNVNPARWSFNDTKEMIEIYFINDDISEFYTIMKLTNSDLVLEIEIAQQIARFEFESVK